MKIPQTAHKTRIAALATRRGLTNSLLVIGALIVFVVLLGKLRVTPPFVQTGKRDGRVAAESDWRDGTATLGKLKRTEVVEENLCISWGWFDPELGLSTGTDGKGLFHPNATMEDVDCHPSHESYAYLDAFDRAYDERVRELLDEHGIPAWSMKDHLVRKEALVQQLDSQEMRRVTGFPFAIDKRFGLSLEMHDNAGTKLYYYFLTIHDPALAANSRYRDPTGTTYRLPLFTEFNEPTKDALFVGALPEFDDTVFVRRATESVEAYYRNGECVGTAHHMSAAEIDCRAR